jgi:hypothetical protein
LLAVSEPLVLLDQHRAGSAVQPIATTNHLLNQKSIRTFSTGPVDLETAGAFARSGGRTERPPSRVPKHVDALMCPLQTRPQPERQSGCGHKRRRTIDATREEVYCRADHREVA